MLLNLFKKNPSVKNQYIAAFAVNLITLSHGCIIGWLSPVLPYLLGESHLDSGPVTVDEVSWIGSILCVGGFIGTISFGYLNDLIGKKRSLLLLAIPHFAFWLCLYFATDVFHLYIARMLAGLSGGGALRTIPLYIAEISENNIRGSLGSFLILFMNFGILLGFISGAFLGYFIVPLVTIIIPVLFLCIVVLLPDTPYSLIKQQKFEEAKKSIMFYRTSKFKEKAMPEPVKQEFEILKKSIENLDNSQAKLEISDFTNKQAKKGLLIGLFLMWLNQFSGCFALMNYTASVFKESGSDLSPNESSIIVAFIQLLGSYVASFLVDKCGRKILMIISTTLTSVGYCIVGTYSYLKSLGYNMTALGWIPILGLSLVIFVASLGILTLPFVIVAEVLPQKIRGVASTVCAASVTLCAFVVIKLFPILIQEFHLYGAMWIFSTICIISMCVILFFLPETKGKNLVN